MRSEQNTTNVGRPARNLLSALAAVAVFVSMAATVQAEWPANVEAELRKLGRVVEPGCTAKLVRPFFPKNDYNTYWPVDAAAPNKGLKLYPGITLDRDVNFGPMPRDLADIFTSDKGGSNRTVIIYVPGGGGNKIEQQAVEANEFYDNIGRWATENGMVGVTLQRSATNIPVLIDWLKANVTKYKGNPESMFIWAHSAGNGPLGQYIGRPDLYGIGVKGAIFMSGNPVNFGPPAAGRGGAGAPGGAPVAGAAPGGGGAAANAAAPAAPQAAGGRGNNPTGQIGTSECTNTGGAGGQGGVIRGPSSQAAMDQGANAAMLRTLLAGQSPWRWTGKAWENTGAPAPDPASLPQRGGGAGGGRGAAPAGGRGAGGAAAAGVAGNGEVPPPFTTQDGFRSTRVAIMLAWAELDGGVSEDLKIPPAAQLVHDELCKLEGPKAKDGVGHCPVTVVFKGESHMSEVFSLGSSNKTVSTAVLNFINSHK